MAAEKQRERKQKQAVRFSSVNVTHCYDKKLPVSEHLSVLKGDTLVCPVWTKKAASAAARLGPETLETLGASTCSRRRRRPPSCPPKSKGAPSSSNSNRLGANISSKVSKTPNLGTDVTKKFLGSIFSVPANLSKCRKRAPPPGPPPSPQTPRDRAMAMAIELSKKNSNMRGGKGHPKLPTPALHGRTVRARHPPLPLRSSSAPAHPTRAPPSIPPPPNIMFSPPNSCMKTESRPPLPPTPPAN